MLNFKERFRVEALHNLETHCYFIMEPRREI